MSRNYDEKRDYYRMTVDCPVRFAPVGGTHYTEGLCRNFSAGGIQFVSSTSVSLNQLLDVNITPTMSVVPPLNAIIEVIRCDPDTQGFIIAGVIKEMK